MEYQKIINLLDNTPNQPSKFKTSMLKSRFCDYSDAYILVKGTITVKNKAAQSQSNDAANKKLIFKNCAPFTDCISRINNMQVDDAYDIDVVMPMYNLIWYIDNYSKTSGVLWQYCSDEPDLAANAITDFNAANGTTV